jgi:hypothetical protein
MAQVPSLPSNGQPIDTQYIYDIVNSLISINNSISTVGTTFINTPNANTANVNFDAQTFPIATSAKVTKDTVLTGQIPFRTTFSQNPVVTLTVVSKSTTTVNANVTITGVDTSAVYWKATFDGEATTSLDLNVIAIGL